MKTQLFVLVAAIIVGGSLVSAKTTDGGLSAVAPGDVNQLPTSEKAAYFPHGGCPYQQHGGTTAASKNIDVATAAAPNDSASHTASGARAGH